MTLCIISTSAAMILPQYGCEMLVPLKAGCPQCVWDKWTRILNTSPVREIEYVKGSAELSLQCCPIFTSLIYHDTIAQTDHTLNSQKALHVPYGWCVGRAVGGWCMLGELWVAGVCWKICLWLFRVRGTVGGCCESCQPVGGCVLR